MPFLLKTPLRLAHGDRVVIGVFCAIAIVLLLCLPNRVLADDAEKDDASSSSSSANDENANNGLGTSIAWVSLKEGLNQALEEDKHLVLIIHKSWCGACKALMPKIKASKELAEMSAKFVMVNVMDDQEPQDDLYKPDGGYIPRILFFDPKGNLLKDVINETGNAKYKYYYSDVKSIMASMKSVLTSSKGVNEEQKDEADENTKSEL